MSALRGAGFRSGAILVVMAAAVIGCRKPPEGGQQMMGQAGRWIAGFPGQNQSLTLYYIKERVSFPGASNQDTVFTGDYPCKKCPGKIASLTVTPEEKAFQIDWNYAFSNDKDEGAIVAKLKNDNGFAVDEYGLKAHDSVYMYVGPISTDGSERAVAFYNINMGDGSATRAPTIYTTVTYCDMKGSNGRTRSAAHGQHPPSSRCHTTQYPAPSGAAAATTTAELPSLFRNASFSATMFRSDGTWISCMYGCCEVGFAN